MAIAELWEQLQEDPPELHRFFPGVSDEALRAAEAVLRLKLPRSYVRFLELTNGALLFGGERILGVGHSEPGFDLVAVVQEMQNGQPPLHPRLVPFAPTGDGGADCFLVEGSLRDGEYPVVFWSPQDQGREVTHDSFDEWLFELTETMRPEPEP